ncbi:hypothetical protein [Gimesia aquarii]|uniref:Peptidase S26 domain-containing protein n=1 Tax=Gimesia aquarii TaxID=2527964 RepID=A0A517WZM7_9PLAN|nr:hypothetical protein [Gimesia aquarii]QDU10707.1 hypothetical protein V202x_41190 [Gimesia aquarii]
MQCPSCQFENMPGSALCARCRTSLKLADATIDVNPPRAKPNSLRLPGWARLKIALSERFSGQIDTSIDFLSYGGALKFNRSMLFRWIIPGWLQLTFNRPRRACFFFFGYLFFLSSGILLMGTLLGAWLIGFAFALHFGSITDVVFAAKTSVQERISSGFLIGLCLYLLFYLPVGWGISQIIRPQTMVNDYGSFRAEDILWVRQNIQLAPGEYVHYVNSEALINNTTRERVPQYRVTDTGVSRVLAGPGQEVTIKEGVLFVDGEISPFPTSKRFAKDLTIRVRVPSDSYFIDPTGRIPVTNALIRAQNIRQVCLIQSGNVRGRVIYRSYPFSRITLF